MAQKNFSFNSCDLALYDYAKITFIHPVINAQSHAKVGLLLFIHPVYCFKGLERLQIRRILHVDYTMEP